MQVLNSTVGLPLNACKLPLNLQCLNKTKGGTNASQYIRFLFSRLVLCSVIRDLPETTTSVAASVETRVPKEPAEVTAGSRLSQSNT